MAEGLDKYRSYRALFVVVTLALVGVLVAMTRVWTPLPQIVAWWDRLNELAKPPPAWDVRLGGEPDLTAVVASGQVIAASRGFVNAYDARTGKLTWHYDAPWGLPAGDVVVLRETGQHPDEDGSGDLGYSVVDASSGVVLWGQRDAIAVWVYADRILDLTCSAPGVDGCLMRAYDHRDSGHQLWSLVLPAQAHAIRGADPGLVGTRDPARWFAKAAAGSPGSLPTVIGLTVDGQVQVIDTLTGRLIRSVAEPGPDTRIWISGERLLYSRVDVDQSGCHFSLQAVDFRTFQPAWHTTGLNLGTASGTACVQHDDPIGAEGYLAAVDADLRPTLVDAADGSPAWTGVPSEKVLATDGQLGVVLAADRKTIRVIDLLSPGAPVVWTGTMGLEPQAAITPEHVVIRDGDAQRLVVLSHSLTGPGQIINTRSDVVGFGPGGLVLASGRRIGVIPTTG